MFKSQAGQSDTVLPTACHRYNHSSKEAVLAAGAMTHRWAPPTRYTLRRITASRKNERFNLCIGMTT